MRGLSCTTTCTNSPSVRNAASMAYDPANGGQLVLFGGTNGADLSDTWTWNGSSRQVANTGDTTSPRLTNSPRPATGRPWRTTRPRASWSSSAVTAPTTTATPGPGTTQPPLGPSFTPAASPARPLISPAWPTTPLPARWSCSVAATAAAITTTHGTGTAPPGDSCRPSPARGPHGLAMAYDTSTLQMVLFGG